MDIGLGRQPKVSIVVGQIGSNMRRTNAVSLADANYDVGVDMPNVAPLDHMFVDLDENGDLLDVTGHIVAVKDLRLVLPVLLRIPPSATDIVVYVHGWRNDKRRASTAARKLISSVRDLYAQQPHSYQQLKEFRPYGIAIRWPSMSSPLPSGYRRIRDRAHAMTTHGRAGLVLAQILGYLNETRRKPTVGRPHLRTADSQYLHCVGHSFGGRFLGEAIMAAASPVGPPRLGWPWANPDYPYTVDTLLVFQMAAHPTIFDEQFGKLLRDAPINGPVALTLSRHDRATRLWHRLAEGTPGIGAIGAVGPASEITTITLHRLGEPYVSGDVRTRLLNVAAHWRYRRSRWRIEGAHSDFWYPESMHLLLTLIALAR